MNRPIGVPVLIIILQYTCLNYTADAIPLLTLQKSFAEIVMRAKESGAQELQLNKQNNVKLLVDIKTKRLRAMVQNEYAFPGIMQVLQEWKIQSLPEDLNAFRSAILSDVPLPTDTFDKIPHYKHEDDQNVLRRFQYWINEVWNYILALKGSGGASASVEGVGVKTPLTDQLKRLLEGNISELEENSSNKSKQEIIEYLKGLNYKPKEYATEEDFIAAGFDQYSGILKDFDQYTDAEQKYLNTLKARLKAIWEKIK